MKGLYAAFGTDRKAELEGVWRDLGVVNEDNTKPGFLLARMSRNNTNYWAKVEAVAKEYKTEINLDIFTDAAAHQPMLEIFVDTILLGWRHVVDKAGKPIEYSRDNAIKLLTDLPDLYELLREWASKISSFRDADIAASSGE